MCPEGVHFDLPAAQHRTSASRQRRRGTALPGPVQRRTATGPYRRTPVGPEPGERHQGVPEGWRPTGTRGDVARRHARRRTDVEGISALRRVVLPLHAEQREGTRMDRTRQSLPPAGVVESALEKASRYYIGHVDFRPSGVPCWTVLSGSETGELYRVAASGIVAPKGNWWNRLSCTCPAGQKGMRVCWHKAAVWLHVSEAIEEVDAYRYSG